MMTRILLLLVMVLALLSGCNSTVEENRVPVTADQRKQIRELRKKFSDETISQWSGDRLLREMKSSSER